MPIQVQTDLPDEDQPVLGNGVEDEISVDRETAPTNYGDIRIQIRETGASAWDSSAAGFSEFLASHDTVTMEFVGREDGEEYEVRARTETEHATGAWTDPVSIITKFPGVTDLLVTGSGKTTVDLEGTDNADNESGIRIERQREYKDGWGPWRGVEDVEPFSGTGAFTYTDNSVSPGNTYRYRAIPYTEHTSAASTSTGSVTTTSSGRPRTSTGSTGWTVEVDHSSGHTLRPRLLDDPQQAPQVNDLPRIRIPVPYDEKWTASGFENATIRVWQDGQQQPIETLVDVTHETRQNSKRTILHGEGGRELKQTITQEFDLKEIHTAVADLVSDSTPYATDVDAPQESIRKDVAMKSVDSQSEWQNDLINSIGASTPLELTSDGKLAPLQTSFTMEAENVSYTFADNRGTYSGGKAIFLVEGATYGPWSFTLSHDVPSDRVGVDIRYYVTDSDDTSGSDSNPPFSILLDDTEILQVPENTLVSGTVQWMNISNNVTSTVKSGGHDIKIEVQSGSTNEAMYVDLVNFHDKNYHEVRTFPNSNDGNGGPLPGPQNYPWKTREFSDSSSGQQIVGGRLEASLNDTSGQQEVAISNDQGASWITEMNSEVVDGEFSTVSSRIRARFKIGPWGSRSDATPSEGYKRQEVDLYDLYADLDETPTLINQSVDDHLDRVLRDWANQGGFIWEVQLQNGTPTLVWTQPGQRETTVNPSLVDYRTRKRTGEVYEAITVVGASTGVAGEPFYAGHGAAVSLNNEHLVDGSETVYDPSTGQNYVRGSDYEIRYLDGTITTLSGGSMTDGAEFAVDYRFETRGSYALDSAETPREAPKQSIPGLTSAEACEQAAATIVTEVSEPLWEVEFTLSPSELGWQVTDALQMETLPVSKPVEVQQVENSPSKITVTGGSRQTVEQVVREIRERVDQIARRS